MDDPPKQKSRRKTIRALEKEGTEKIIDKKKKSDEGENKKTSSVENESNGNINGDKKSTAEDSKKVDTDEKDTKEKANLDNKKKEMSEHGIYVDDALKAEEAVKLSPDEKNTLTEQELESKRKLEEERRKLEGEKAEILRKETEKNNEISSKEMAKEDDPKKNEKNLSDTEKSLKDTENKKETENVSNKKNDISKNPKSEAISEGKEIADGVIVGSNQNQENNASKPPSDINKDNSSTKKMSLEDDIKEKKAMDSQKNSMNSMEKDKKDGMVDDTKKKDDMTLKTNDEDLKMNDNKHVQIDEQKNDVKNISPAFTDEENEKIKAKKKKIIQEELMKKEKSASDKSQFLAAGLVPSTRTAEKKIKPLVDSEVEDDEKKEGAGLRVDTDNIDPNSELAQERRAGEILYEGNIHKKRFFFSCFWHQRYFTLKKDGSLKYYRDKNSKGKGGININIVRDLHRLDEINKKHSFRILLRYHDGEDILAFDDESERNRWAAKLATARKSMF